MSPRSLKKQFYVIKIMELFILFKQIVAYYSHNPINWPQASLVHETNSLVILIIINFNKWRCLLRNWIPAMDTD
ncbi:hypothetical protein DEH80_16990 [Abyssibacter profundi]|uniref:Uncharacterized protein n=1 Tax=Abyssibacter profundi TaxID=2182787 RepID=A0A383XPH1_9GAMM|nr:hypothetical protein DEH80_16990 [Abyssibacter profundi]